jgi:tetratricopeptide (TPR) repeat protein
VKPAYALFIGAVFGLCAFGWVERDRIGAVASALREQIAALPHRLGTPTASLEKDPQGSAPGPDGSPPGAGPAHAEEGAGEVPMGQAGLDQLFAALRLAPDAEEAQRLEAAIFAELSRSTSPTVNLMMNGAAVMAEREGGTDAVADVYARIVRLDPSFAEGHARLAASAFEAGDLAGAERSLRTAVRLEPRHFAAWTGLGAVLEQVGDARGAAEAYREALWLNPWADTARRGLARVETRTLGLPL